MISFTTNNIHIEKPSCEKQISMNNFQFVGFEVVFKSMYLTHVHVCLACWPADMFEDQLCQALS